MLLCRISICTPNVKASSFGRSLWFLAAGPETFCESTSDIAHRPKHVTTPRNNSFLFKPDGGTTTWFGTVFVLKMLAKTFVRCHLKTYHVFQINTTSVFVLRKWREICKSAHNFRSMSFENTPRFSDKHDIHVRFESFVSEFPKMHTSFVRCHLKTHHVFQINTASVFVFENLKGHDAWQYLAISGDAWQYLAMSIDA